MTSFTLESSSLQENGFLPSPTYFSASNFIAPYRNVRQFSIELIEPVVMPIANGLAACYYAMRAVWATLRTIGNLLILKPLDAVGSFGDVCVHTTLSFALAVMAPIHAIVDSIRLLTRTVASWIADEPTYDLSSLGFVEKFMLDVKELTDDERLLSRDYFNKDRFFTAYPRVGDFFFGMGKPIFSPVVTVFESLYHADLALRDALVCIANLLIAKPRHAGEAARDFGVHLSLTVSLAVMAPINALIDAIAFVTRLGTTWHSACTADEENRSEVEGCAAAL